MAKPLAPAFIQLNVGLDRINLEFNDGTELSAELEKDHTPQDRQARRRLKHPVVLTGCLLFYYPFWPEAYDNAYWAYASTIFFDSVYWAEGNPYGEYSYGAPR